MAHMLIRYAKYTASRLLLKTVNRHKVFEVPMNKCINPLGFSFGENGWHFLVEYLKELKADPSVLLCESVLYRYHKMYQPASMKELIVFSDNNVEFNLDFFRFPWGNYKKEFDHNLPTKDRCTSRFCGPSDDDLIEKESMDIVKLRNSINSTGYSPWRFPHSFIAGVCLKRENSDFRFVILQGNHRTAVLSYLGYKKIIARIQPGCFPIIKEQDVENWYYVKNGMCSIKDALIYFHTLFNLDGSERAVELGFK